MAAGLLLSAFTVELEWSITNLPLKNNPKKKGKIG